MLAAVLMSVMIIIRIIEKYHVYKVDIRSWKMSIPLLFPLMFMIVSIWAVDRPVAIIGGLNWLPVSIWVWICYQMDTDEIDTILRIIPVSGSWMVIISLLTYLNKYTRSLFWQAERMGGTFQYSNTCALYILIGIVLLLNGTEKDGDKKKNMIRLYDYLQALLLFTGLLLTGSRSILIIAIIWGVYKAITERKHRSLIILSTFIALAIGVVIVIISGSFQNAGRIVTILSNKSTILGRLLYVKDGIRILQQNPCGLGWQGYYYVQPHFQHGLYTTRFIHNEYLQTALDIGILPTFFLMFYLIWQLLRGKQGKTKKEVLCLIMTAAFMDFHMQFFSIVMIGILCLDLKGGEKPGVYTKINIIQKMQIIAVAFFGSILLIPYIAEQLNYNTIVRAFFPYYTETEILLLDDATNIDDAEKMAEEILKHNQYVAKAYQHLGTIAAMRGDIDSFILNMNMAIDNSKYNIKMYRYYDMLLSDLLNKADLEDKRNVLIKEKNNIPVRLSELKDETDPLAFLIRDVPEFEL